MDDHVAHMRLALANAPRCKARSKQSGQKCQGFCVKGFPVCRMHGARSNPPTGERHGRYRHGRYTKQSVAGRKMIAELLREVRASMAMMCEGL
jgi:glucans biosynthesis protein